MNHNFSIVIVCKNEAEVLPHLLRSAQTVTDDIVVYDNGSTDDTVSIAKAYGARVFEGSWEGYGKTKRKAALLAKYQWVLSLDADEILDDTLQNTLRTFQFKDDKTVYRIPFKSFLGDKYLRWGEWGGDSHIRLFNRALVQWDGADVHEKLLLPDDVKVETLKGSVLHRTMKDTVEYSHKMVHYALLNAEKYFEKGKRSSWVKRYLAPKFTFVKYYFFQAGFLDGWEGLLCARMTAFYTALKYARLRELEVLAKKKK
ncbi:MAG: glycosyltransferase family 2 protein [Chitinophagaceae bacterium]